jgi:flagellar basal body-associated protein FliL
MRLIKQETLMKKDLLVKWAALCALISLIALPAAAQEKCWSKENQFLERGTYTTIGYLQAKKFCYCVEGFYGYMDIRTKPTPVAAPAYAYTDPFNSSDWSTAEHRTSVRIDMVRCNAAGKWYPTDQDYYREGLEVVTIPETPETTVEQTVETMETVPETTVTREETPAMPARLTTTTETAPPAGGWTIQWIIPLLLLVAGSVVLLAAAAGAYLYLKNKKKKAVVKAEPVKAETIKVETFKAESVKPETVKAEAVEQEKASNAEYEQQKKKVEEIKDQSIKTLDDYAAYKMPDRKSVV